MTMRWLGMLAITAACSGSSVTTFSATKEGTPSWKTAGWALYNAPDDDRSPQKVFSLHAYDPAANAFVPRVVHPPPYETEVADHLAMLDFPTGDRFRVEDWTYPLGILTAAVIVPSTNAPTGSTSDFASGPYIPKDLALSVDGDLYKDGAVVDPNFDSMYPTLESVQPSAAVDGWSHMTLTFGEDTSFIPGTAGHYRLHVHVYEVAAPTNGWQIDVPFDVE